MRTRLASLALFAALTLPFAASASAPQVKTAAPGFQRAILGTFEITAISDGTSLLPMDTLLQGEPKAEIDQTLAANALTAPTVTSFNAFLVNTGSKLVLIDTGNGASGLPGTGQLAQNLRAAGYSPEQVDEIYITHMHGDHIGGLVTNGARAFPNAIVRADKRESDYWISGEGAAKAPGVKAAFAPYIAANAFKPFTGQTALVPGVTAIPAYGHTPGHTAYLVQSGDKKLLAFGDVVHVAAVQFPKPAIAIAFDWSQPTARATRQSLFMTTSQDGEWVAGAHIPFPGIGKIAKDGNAYRWIPVNYSPIEQL